MNVIDMWQAGFETLYRSRDGEWLIGCAIIGQELEDGSTEEYTESDNPKLYQRNRGYVAPCRRASLSDAEFDAGGFENEWDEVNPEYRWARLPKNVQAAWRRLA